MHPEIDFANPGQCEAVTYRERAGMFNTIPIGEPVRCPNLATGWTLQGAAACAECHAKHASFGRAEGCPNQRRIATTTTTAAW